MQFCVTSQITCSSAWGAGVSLEQCFFFLPPPPCQELGQVACYSLIFSSHCFLKRLESIEFVLPSGCWAGRSKSGGGLLTLRLWTGLWYCISIVRSGIVTPSWLTQLWNNTQATIHPSVANYRTMDTHSPVSYVVISDLPCYDTVSVHPFHCQHVDHSLPYTKLHLSLFWRLTCPYKNKNIFINLCCHHTHVCHIIWQRFLWRCSRFVEQPAAHAGLQCHDTSSYYGAQQAPIHGVLRALSLMVKWLRHEADHSPPPCAYTATSQMSSWCSVKFSIGTTPQHHHGIRGGRRIYFLGSALWACIRYQEHKSCIVSF